jgi:hypothetical protein
MKNKIIFIIFMMLSVFYACENQDWKFPDYDYATVYFAYQSPVRTIELGDDTLYDNTLDKLHQCLIIATTGGAYENKKDITIGLEVDNSLCDSLRFENATGDSVIAMPSNYYSLPAEMQIVIPAGKVSGGIKVQLTDAFFADPRSIKNTFVIPLRMTSVTNADSILSGKSNLANPDRRVAGDWTAVPKDYILYAIKYVNPWHGTYLRRGIEVVKGNGGNTALDTTVVYHKKYVENDEVVHIYTKSMTEDTISLRGKNVGNLDVPFTLVLKFDNDGKCTISNPATASYTLTGNGKFVKNGDMWGSKKRDVLHLQYEVNFGITTHTFTDTIVMRDRNVKFETFTPVVQ